MTERLHEQQQHFAYGLHYGALACVAIAMFLYSRRKAVVKVP